MTPIEATGILARMTTVWPNHDVNPAEVLEWSSTLTPIDVKAAIATVDALKAETTFFPSHQQFLAVAKHVAHRMSQERGLAAPPDKDCHRCGSTGWVEVATLAGHPNAVEACRCIWGHRKTPRLSTEDHPRDCSCTRCHYGPRRSETIRAGADGGVVPADLRPVREPAGFVGQDDF